MTDDEVKQRLVAAIREDTAAACALRELLVAAIAHEGLVLPNHGFTQAMERRAAALEELRGAWAAWDACMATRTAVPSIPTQRPPRP